jgi:hypothetical protein
MRMVLQNLFEGLRIFITADWPKAVKGQRFLIYAHTDGFMSNVHYLNQTQRSEAVQMELMVSKKVESSSMIFRLSSRLKLFVALLIAGILGAVGYVFAMLNTGQSADKMQEMGLNRAANSLENILSLMAYPVLLLMILFVAYASMQIYKEYRTVYNPENYGRSRKR